MDTAGEPDPNSVLTYGGLVATAIGPPSTRYVAMLDSLPPTYLSKRSFYDWWNRAVFFDGQRRLLSRRELVTTMADQDGGSHVDSELEARYYDLTRRNSLGWEKGVGSEPPRPMSGPERAAIRQIGHEVLRTEQRIFLCTRRDVMSHVRAAAEKSSSTVTDNSNGRETQVTTTTLTGAMRRSRMICAAHRTAAE